VDAGFAAIYGSLESRVSVTCSITALRGL
jgi:hypothetical protein